MPSFGGDNSAQTAIALMQMIQGIKERKVQEAQLHLQNLLGMATPGTTFQQLGLSDKDLKRALGRVPQPNEVAKVMTPEEFRRKNQLSFLEQADPRTLQSLAMTTAATQSGAPSAVYTPQSFKEVGQLNESEASTSRQISQGTSKARVKQAQIGAENNVASTQLIGDQIDAAIGAWKGMDDKSRSLISQKNILGQTAGEAQANEVSQNLKAEMQKNALKAVVDPKHPLNNFFRSLGVAPAAGYAMIAMGAENLIDSRAQMIARLAIGQQEASNIMLKADLNVAEDVGKKFGASASSVLGQMRMMETGKEPKTDLGRSLQIGMNMVYKATISDAAQKGDPEFVQLQQLIDGAKKFSDNPEMLANYSKLINHQAAVMVMRQKGIEKPIEPFARAQYDATVNGIERTMSTFKERDWWKIWQPGSQLAGPQSSGIPLPRPQQAAGDVLQAQVQGARSQANVPGVDSLNQFLQTLKTDNQSPETMGATAAYLKALQQAGQQP